MGNMPTFEFLTKDLLDSFQKCLGELIQRKSTAFLIKFNVEFQFHGAYPGAFSL